jgi:hypothetical protein
MHVERARQAYEDALRDARQAKKGTKAQKEAVARLVPLWEEYCVELHDEILRIREDHPPAF